MLTVYQAIVTGNQIQWQDTAPNLDHKQVIITVLSSDTSTQNAQQTKENPPNYANGDFSFDLERMQSMMDTEFKEVPKEAMSDLDNFENWIKIDG